MQQFGNETLAKVIVGLGNPGERYAGTRHNIGFMALDALARERSGRWVADAISRICRVELANHPVLLVEPLTYMNLSGRAVQAVLATLELGPQDLLLITDDLNIPFGRIRVRQRGSAGGHHGLESIMNSLQTDEIARIRMGIGEEQMPEDKAEFVLSEFPPEKKTDLDAMILKAGNAAKSILVDGMPKTMALYNA